MVSGHLKNHHLSNQRGSFQNMFTRAQCMFMACVKRKKREKERELSP
jgi:hypothetical protein